MPPQSLSLNRSSRAAAPYLFLSQSVDICLCIFPLYTRIESDWRVYKNDQQSYHPNVDSHKHTHSHTHLRVYKSFWIVFSFRCIPKSFSMGDENATPISSLRERSTRTLTLARTCMWVCECVRCNHRDCYCHRKLMHTPLLSVFKLLLKWAGFAASFMPHFRCCLRIPNTKTKCVHRTEWIECDATVI